MVSYYHLYAPFVWHKTPVGFRSQVLCGQRSPLVAQTPSGLIWVLYNTLCFSLLQGKGLGFRCRRGPTHAAIPRYPAAVWRGGCAQDPRAPRRISQGISFPHTPQWATDQRRIFFLILDGILSKDLTAF